jgi:sulfhydrogenase subunit beta (sulfur reductase)
MTESSAPAIGATVAIQKAALTRLISALTDAGYECIGPRLRDGVVAYETISELDQMPQGFVTEQAPGRFRLIDTGHSRYFDFIPAAQSWKQFLFPPRLSALRLRRNGASWQPIEPAPTEPAYAFIGVRACELAAIQIQDKAFLRTDFIDPVYGARRSNAFILAINCLHPAGTCFCATMSTGPRVGKGFDLCLTELEDVFLMEIGSELGRGYAADLPYMAASAFMLGNAERGLDQARRQARAEFDPGECAQAITQNLEHQHWKEVAGRCLGCGNCTLVCPTCFCWDVVDHLDLKATETDRERIWDSCFNPSHSYQSGGNTRPTIRARYRQWLSHKFANWQQQFGTSGCVGCGRCITWCPVGIDVRKEVAALKQEQEVDQ